MAEEDLENLDETSEVQEQQQTDPVAGLKSALEKERKARERFERELKAVRFLRDNPHLTEDDLKGVPADRWDYWAQRLKPADSTKSDTSAEDTITDAERSGIERLADRANGSGTPVADEALKMTAVDADRKFKSGEWSQAQYEGWMRKKYAPTPR